jgi:hypothetical protein
MCWKKLCWLGIAVQINYTSHNGDFPSEPTYSLFIFAFNFQHTCAVEVGTNFCMIYFHNLNCCWDHLKQNCSFVLMANNTQSILFSVSTVSVMWPYVYFLQFKKFHNSMNVSVLFQNINNIIFYPGWIISIMDNQSCIHFFRGSSMCVCMRAHEHANSK